MNEQNLNSEPHSDVPPKKKKRSWPRRIVRWLLLTVVCILLLPFALLVSWQVDVIRIPLVQWGATFAGVALEGEVSVGDIRGDLVTHIIIQDVRWKDRQGKMMASLKRVEAHYDLLHFFKKGELLVTKVLIRRPFADIGMAEYGLSPRTDGTTQIQRLHLKNPKERSAARQKYALVTSMLTLASHIKPTIPVFCKTNAICGKTAFCKPFVQAPASAFSAWKGTCESKPKPKPKNEAPSTFKLAVRSVRLEELNASFRPGPDSQPIGVKDLGLHATYTMNGPEMRAVLSQMKLKASNPNVEITELGLRFWMKGKKLTAKNILIRLAGGSVIRLDAGLHLLPILGIDAQIKKILVTAQDMKGIVPSWPIRPNIHLQGSATGSLGDLHAKLQGRFGRATLGVDAKSSILAQTYDAKIQVKTFDLAEFMGKPGLKSLVSLQLKAKGKGFSDATHGDIRLNVERGFFQQWHFDRLNMSAQMKDRTVDVKKLDVHTPYGHIHMKANAYIPTGRIRADLRGLFPKIQRVGAVIKQKMSGSVRLQAHVEGTKWIPGRGTKASVFIERFRHPAARVRKAKVHVRLKSLLPNIDTFVDLDAFGVRAGGRFIRKAFVSLNFGMKGSALDVDLERLQFDLGSGLYRLEKQAWIRGRRRSITTHVSFHLKRMLAKVSRLWLRRYRETLRVDGWIDLKRWRQDLSVSVQKLNLSALRRALGILPKSRLAGVLGLDVRFRGSFYRPQLGLQLRLRNGRFQHYKKLHADVAVDYGLRSFSHFTKRGATVIRRDMRRRRSRYRQRINVHINAAMGDVKLVNIQTSLPVGLALKGRLPGPLILKNPPIRLGLKKPLLVDVRVPTLALPRLRHVIRQYVGGSFGLHLRIAKTLANPELQLRTRLKNASWKQISYQKIYDKKSKKYRRVRRVGLKVERVDASFLIQYERGRLFFHPDSNWIRTSGQSLLTLSGRLPLFFSMFSKRRNVAFRYGFVQGQPLNFALKLSRRRLRSFWPLMPPALVEKVRSFRGIFEAGLRLGGKPLRPEIDLTVSLSKASLCPLVEGAFVCYKKRSIYASKRSKRKSLRIRGVHFDFNVQYRPPVPGSVALQRNSIQLRAPGNLQLSSVLRVGRKTLFEIRKKLKKGSQKYTGIPLAFAIHPHSLKPSFRLFVKDPIRFQLHVPKFNLSSGKTFCSGGRKARRRATSEPAIVDFVRLPILRRLRGAITLNVLLRKTLEGPRLNVDFKWRKGGYLFDCDDRGRPLWIDGLKVAAGVAVNSGLAIVFARVDVMRKPVLRARLQLDVKAGLAAVIGRKGTVQYKPKVHIGRTMFARVLLCRFQLQKLGKLGGFFKKLTGTLQGHLLLKGDPACPVFHSLPREKRSSISFNMKNPCEGVQRTSHILLSNLVLGTKPKHRNTPRRIRRKKKAAAFLHIRKLRFDLKSTGRGQTQLKLRSSQLTCARHKFRVRSASDRTHLKKLLRFARKHCPHKKISPPSRGGFPWWLWRIKNVPMLNLDFRGALPIRITKIKPSELRTRCPHWQGKPPSKDLFVKMEAPGIPLQFVESFVSGLKMKAFFGANVLMESTKGKPLSIRRGQVNLDIKQLKYPAYGVELLSGYKRRSRKRSLVRVTFANNFYGINGRLQGVRGTPITIRGKIKHKSFIPQTFDIRIRSKAFRPMDTPKYKLALTTDIRIRKKASRKAPIRVKGRIIIPQMLFTLPNSSGGPSTYQEDKDIVVLGEASEKRLYKKKKKGDFDRPPSSSGGGLNVDLSIKIPRNFIVRNKELQIEAKTDRDNGLEVKLGKGRLRLAGGIEIVRGELSQFGKRFSVQSGSGVAFTGQSIPMSQIGSRIDPRLNIAAVYILNVSKGSSLANKGHKKVKVFLIVGGSAQAPKISFRVQDAFTEQVIPLDKVNVIALILTGSTTEDLSSGQQKNILNQAFGMVGRALASELRNQLSGVVPLDVLNIETGARAEDLKVDVGWYLGPSLYFQLSLKPVPLDEESYWEALFDWSINRQLSLEVKAGQMKRNDSPLFRGSTYLFYRIKY